MFILQRQVHWQFWHSFGFLRECVLSAPREHRLGLVKLATRRGWPLLFALLLSNLELMNPTAHEIFLPRAVECPSEVLPHHDVELVVHFDRLGVHKLGVDFLGHRQGLIDMPLHLFEVSIQLHLPLL